MIKCVLPHVFSTIDPRPLLMKAFVQIFHRGLRVQSFRPSGSVVGAAGLLGGTTIGAFTTRSPAGFLGVTTH